MRKHIVALLIVATAAVAGSLTNATAAHAANHIVGLENWGNEQCLQPANGSLEAGASIVQVPCGPTGAQLWEFIPLGGTSFRVRNVNSGLCLDALGGAVNGTPVVQWPCANISNQKWDTGSQLPDFVYLTSQVAGTHSHCLDVPGAQNIPGLAMQLFGCNHTAAQYWGAGLSIIRQS